MPGGAIPDAGATLAALEHMTGRKPDLIGGKPSPLMLRVAGELLQLPPQRCLLAGDRLETDIRMAQQAGFTSVLVLSGVTRREHLAGLEQPPDLVIENLASYSNLSSKRRFILPALAVYLALAVYSQHSQCTHSAVAYSHPEVLAAERTRYAASRTPSRCCNSHPGCAGSPQPAFQLNPQRSTTPNCARWRRRNGGYPVRLEICKNEIQRGLDGFADEALPSWAASAM